MKKLLFVAMTCALFASACNTTSDEPVLPTRAQLRFSNVATLGVVTRATVDYTAPFKINLTTNDAYGAAVEGMSVTKAGEVWNTATAVYLTRAERTLVAWAPESLTVPAETNKFSLQSAKYDATKDLIYYSQQVSATASEVNVEFKHAYALMTFKLTTENYPNANPKLNALKVNGVVPTANLDLTAETPVLEGGGTPAALEVVSGGTEAFPDSVQAMVVPSSTAPTVTCTLDGTEYGPISLTGVTSLEAGNEYVVTMKVKGTQMTVASVKVQERTPVEVNVDLN